MVGLTEIDPNRSVIVLLIHFYSLFGSFIFKYHSVVACGYYFQTDVVKFEKIIDPTELKKKKNNR